MEKFLKDSENFLFFLKKCNSDAKDPRSKLNETELFKVFIENYNKIEG